jgi:hypothetical protein
MNERTKKIQKEKIKERRGALGGGGGCVFVCVCVHLSVQKTLNTQICTKKYIYITALETHQ